MDVPEGDTANETNGLPSLKQRANKTLKAQLKSMVTAAVDVLDKVKVGYYGTCEDPNQNCDFARKMLSLKEIAFFEKHNSVEKILTNLKNAIEAAPAYELFMEDQLSEKQQTGT